MREYYVTVNTPLVLELPVLTVTARTAFFVPYPWLPAEDDANREAGERGRETWVDAVAVEGARFELARLEDVTVQPDRVRSGTPRALPPGAGDGFTPVTLPTVCQADPHGKHKKHRHLRTGAGDAVVTDSVERAAGSAATVRFSYGRTENGATIISGTSSHRRKPRRVGEACLPLLAVREGDYVLRIMARDEDRSEQQDQRSGPRTTIKAGEAFAYRDLYLWLRFDAQARLKLADVAPCRLEGGRCVTVPLTDAETQHTHGNVTALGPDELSVDLKPDFLRVEGVTNDAHRASALSGAWSRSPLDLVVIHGTGGSQIGPAINQIKSHRVGPHYEIDRDGHVVKFAYDDSVTGHAAPGRCFDRRTGQYAAGVNPISIGIENVNRSNIHGGDPQEPYSLRQLESLARLVSELRAAHPAVTRERVVGHGDIGVDTVYRHRDGGARTTRDKALALHDPRGNPVRAVAANFLHDRRLTCPGYQMRWRLLESHGIGWEVPQTPPDLTDRDYAGFFTFDLTRLPEKLRRRVAHRWYLQPGDRDSDATYAGITWSSEEVKKLLAAAHVTVNFAGIITSMQRELQQLGYFLPQLDGSLVFGGTRHDEQPTWQALRHFYMRLFCVDREQVAARGPGALAAASDPNDPDLRGAGRSPPLKVSRRVARYLKAIVAGLPAITADASAVPRAAEGHGDDLGDHHERPDAVPADEVFA